jgi:hypothetical protein
VRRIRFFGLRFVLFGVAAAGVLGLVVVGLWNSLVPPLFNLPPINFWQALGLLVLSRVLFGRLGGGWGRRMRGAQFVRGWKDLTPEQRERFRQGMEARCKTNVADAKSAEKA